MDRRQRRRQKLQRARNMHRTGEDLEDFDHADCIWLSVKFAGVWLTNCAAYGNIFVSVSVVD